MSELSYQEQLRYSRHTILPEIGYEGQLRLKRASVLLVGAGGLGSPVALYLAAAGVGRLGLIDHDTVDASNLQRQVLYGQSDLRQPKVHAAARRLKDLNPFIEIVPYNEPFTAANAMDVAKGYDVLADGADNFPARYLCNDVCAFLGIPNVHGSVFRFEGQISTFDARRGPCYRCLYQQPPPPHLTPNCADAGVLGVLPGVIGSLMATEVLKLITGLGRPLFGRLVLYDALAPGFRELTFARDMLCPVCGDNPTITAPINYQAFCGAGAETPAGNQTPANNQTITKMTVITVEELHAMRLAGTPHTLIDVREPHEYQQANMGGVLIPLSQLQSRYQEIPRQGCVILHCRTDQRSARAAEFLAGKGYDNLQVLTGGIIAWRAAYSSAGDD